MFECIKMMPGFEIAFFRLSACPSATSVSCSLLKSSKGGFVHGLPAGSPETCLGLYLKQNIAKIFTKIFPGVGCCTGGGMKK